MKLPGDSHEKMMTAYQMLGQDVLSLSMFESLRTLLKGIHPEVDKKLEKCSKAFDVLQKIQSGDIFMLSAESLPEDTEKKKKKKKTLLFFIQTIKDLQSEIKRVDSQLNSGQNSQNQVMNWGKIIKFAKGPFGLTTLAALLIVGVFLVIHPKKPITPTSVPNAKNQIQVITYNNKQLPLTQLRIANPHYPGCDGLHYHALSSTETVTALDGTTVYDPGGCGFGKVKDLQITTVNK